MNQLNEQQLQQHLNVLGWLHIVGNAIMLLLGCFVFALLWGIGAATGDLEATRILGIIGTTVGALLVVLGIPGIVGGYGLLRRRAWGRILAMVVGFLGLVNFPLGTAIGIYTFWVLLQDAATEYFASSPSST
jgi:hypothetical protein